MKIICEIPAIRITRHLTIAEALSGWLRKSFFERTVGSWSQDQTPEENQEFAEVLHSALWREHEGERHYVRTCALAIVEEDMVGQELYRVLAEHDYTPASLSEGMSYLPTLLARGVGFDSILHLGTRIFGTEFRRDVLQGKSPRSYVEKRLLMKKDGTIELVPFYLTTKLKKNCHIVVVKGEKERH